MVSRTEASRSLHAAACKISNPLKCAACQYDKQHRRPVPGKTPSTVIKDRENILKADDLLPGKRFSVDHFICSTRDQLLTSAGKTKAEEMYTGGCIFVDHASVSFMLNIKKVLPLMRLSRRKTSLKTFAAVSVSLIKNISRISPRHSHLRNLRKALVSFNKLCISLVSAHTITMVLQNATSEQSWQSQEP